MFGYITADYSRLSKTARAEYKSAYCGLCRNLAKRYSAKARFLLSFDTTFLLTVLCAVSGEKSCKSCACPYHFGRKRDCLTGDDCDYAADVTVLLACLNFEDDIKDSHSLYARFLKKLFARDFEKAKKRRPKLYDSLIRELITLERFEKRSEQNADLVADCFGKALGSVFAKNPKLYDFGYYLGKFIYICDALCDFKSDLRHKRYNPLICTRRAEAENMLTFLVDKCIDEIEDNNISNEIINNVLSYGIWLKYSLKYKRKRQ